ncbi:MAG: ATP-binding protein [Chloroflexi bacterium]|nr:ATP-binding protein [Chloroflexota bacterium]
MTTTVSVVHARRSGVLLWVLALLGGILLAGIHLAITYAVLGRIEPLLVVADAALLVIVMAPTAWYISSVTDERQRHAAQVVLLDVLAEPRNIGDAARGALAALVRHQLADAGLIALTDEQGDSQRVLAAIGYPEGWAKGAPLVRHIAGPTPTIRRDRGEVHPWVAPLGATLGKRPWVARIPITSNGDLIGLLLLVSRRGGALRDEVVLATIAAQVGAALDHAALYEASYQRERDLEGLDQRRREFLGALSHEIRTPLMSIQAFADLLRMDNESMDSGADELVSSLTYGVERLNSLVTDLIDLGRSGGQEFEVRLGEVDAVEALRNAEAMMRPALMLCEQHVVGDVPEAPLYAIADPHRLEQVILPILSNANRHAPPNGDIILRAVRTPEGRVRIEVRDFGTGIAREDRDRIFEAYYRVRGPGGESVPGSGLGLAIARRLIEAQGGRIWVESCEDGPGARFCMELRAAPERA